MFAGKEKSDIFKIHSHGIIGGKEDHQRLFITQMGFGSHEYGGIRDAVCQLGKGISRTGGDEQKIQIAFGANGFRVLNGKNGFSSGQTADGPDIFIRASETGTGGLHMGGKDGVQLGFLLYESLYGLFYFIKGTEGPGNSQADRFPFRDIRISLYYKCSSF